MKNKKFFAGILTTMIIAVACCVLFMNDTTTASASGEERYLVNNGIYDNYTDTDKPNGIEIKKYIEEYYAKNAASKGIGAWNKIHINGDDAIVKIIPRSLFSTEGTTFYIGKEYGFYIETTAPKVLTGARHSRVAVFDIKNENNLFEKKDHLLISVTKLFEAEYAYVTPSVNKIQYQADQGPTPYFIEAYPGNVPLVYEVSGNNFVIPVPRSSLASVVFRESNLIYFTDFATKTSLYNINHFNPSDEEYYDPWNDYGAFFTQLDFAYSGRFYKTGTWSASKTGTVVMDAASLSWEVFSAASTNKTVAKLSALKASPLVGIPLAMIDVIKSTAELSNVLSDSIIESIEKKLPYKPFYTFREQQLLYNGFLNKDIQYAVSGIDNQKLYMGTGDSITMDYQITGGTAYWDTMYANIFMMNAVKVRDNNSSALIHDFRIYGETAGQSAVYTDKLTLLSGYTEAPQIQMGVNEKINIMPYSNTMRSIQIGHNGYYSFDGGTNSRIGFSVYSSINCAESDLKFKSQYINGKNTAQVYMTAGTYYIKFIESTNSYILVSDFKFGEVCTVIFDMQDGMGDSSSVTAIYGSAMPSASAPTRTGYTFGGYYTAPNGGGTQYYDANMVSAQSYNIDSDTTLYAKWTANSYNVTLDMQDGTGYNSSVTAVYGSAMPSATVPSRAGLTFDGYYSAPNGGGIQYYDANMVSVRFYDIAGNTTLYAKWTATVTFDMQDGTGETSSVTATYGADMPWGAAPEKKGFAFGGYYSAPNGVGTQYYDANMASVQFYNIAGNTTLYAKWTANSYRVWFSGQEGTGGSSSVMATYGEAMPSATISQWPGLTFGGYYSQRNGGGTQYYDENMISVRSYDIADSITLYAKWTANSYTVTFDKQEGTGGSSSVTAAYRAEMPWVEMPEKTGFAFGGYYSEPNGGGAQYYNADMTSALSYNIAGDTTLYAKWIEGLPPDFAIYEIYYEEINLYAIVYSDGKFVFCSSEGGNYTLESCMRGCNYEIRVCIFEISSSDTELVYYFEEEYVLETIYLKAGVYYFFEINDESDFGIFILMLYQA